MELPALLRDAVDRALSGVALADIARPRKGSGRVTQKLCRPDGSVGERLFSRRDGEAFRRAWRGDWGSAL
jgi:ribosomal protein RSM22 (predicted rRNA methylase)